MRRRRSSGDLGFDSGKGQKQLVPRREAEVYGIWPACVRSGKSLELPPAVPWVTRGLGAMLRSESDP